VKCSWSLDILPERCILFASKTSEAINIPPEEPVTNLDSTSEKINASMPKAQLNLMAAENKHWLLSSGRSHSDISPRRGRDSGRSTFALSSKSGHRNGKTIE
jgi:hypothetical protein